MELCYEGALVMPGSFSMIDEEEMMYLEGGAYTTYTGWQAWNKIAAIVCKVATWCGTAYMLANVAGACVCATPVGTIAAVVSALGSVFAMASAGVHATMAGLAITYTVRNGGFRASSFEFLNWSWDSVKPL